MAENFTEKGFTGVAQWNGRPTERYLASLHGSAGVAKFAQMLRKEPACFTADRLVRLTAQQATWTVVPASESAEDRKAAEFLEQCIGDMSHSLDVAIDNAMTAQWFGFSVLEICWKRRMGRKVPKSQPSSAFDDGLIGVRKLAMRRQETIERWLFDKWGGIQGVVQVDDDYKEIEIPIDKLLHFVVIPDRGNPEGLAIGEVAYKVYHMLENFEIIDGIGAERAHIGLPVFKWTAKPSDADRQAAQAMGQNLVVNEQQYVELPGNIVEFELVSITNTNADALRARINQLRWEIVGLVFGNYIRLGTTDTGNRALSETLADAFTKGVDAMLNTGVAEVLNKHLVPRLFSANPSFDLDVYPRLQPSRIHQLPMFVLQYLEAMQSWLLNSPDEDNLWLREWMGLPYVALRPKEPPKPEPVAPQEPAAQEDEQPVDEPEQEEDDAEAQEFALLSEAAREFVKASQWLRTQVTGPTWVVTST